MAQKNRARTLKLALVTLHSTRDSEAIPLGAGCIAAAVRRAFAKTADRTQIDATLLDFRATDEAPRVAGEILRAKPDLIGFSLYCWNRIESELVAAEIKRIAPEVRLFAGGPDAEWYRYSASGCPFGAVFLKSAEAAVVAWLSSSAAAGLSESVDGGGPRLFDQEPQKASSLASPWLDGTIAPKKGGTVMWELSRGCPYRCAYCYEGKGARGTDYFPLERIERELELFVRAGVGKIFVLDPTFNVQSSRAVDLLKLFSRKGRGIYWYFEVRAELLDEAQARAFAELPCSLQVGMQSAHRGVLKRVGRDIDREKFARKLALLDEYGVVFGLDLIYGLPYDDLDGFRESLDFALSLRPNHLDIFPLSILPGTELFERSEELGLICQKEPPYLLKGHKSFSAADMKKAGDIAEACRIFYSEGRAVPWFSAAIKPLKLRASAFLEASVARTPGSPRPYERMKAHGDIEKFQRRCLEGAYLSAGLAELFPLVSDLVSYYGALSRATAEGEKTIVELSYQPKALENPEVLEIANFFRRVRAAPGVYEVAPGPDGPLVRLISKRADFARTTA